MPYNVPDILYSKIRIKRSLISGETPSSLELGEIAANIPDGKLWIGKQDNTVLLLNEGEVYSAGTSIEITPNNIINFKPEDGSIPVDKLKGTTNGYLKYLDGNWFFDNNVIGSGGGSGFINADLLFSCIGGIDTNSDYFILGGNAFGNNWCGVEADLGESFSAGFGIDISTDNEISVDVSQLGIGESFSAGFGIDISTDNEISVDVNQLGIIEYTGLGDVIISTDNEISVEFTSLSTDLIPDANATWDLGTATNKWKDLYLDTATIYLGDATIKSEENTILVQNLKTQDLTLSNEQSTGNSVDGSTGNWTIQEGENDLFLINNKNGKRYKFVLSEIL